MFRRRSLQLLWLWAIALAYATAAVAQQNELSVDRIFIPSVTVTDPQMIQFFLNELLISEKNVQRIDILDVSQNGFGGKDLVRTYPSGELYFIFPSDTLQKIMDTWRFKANFQIVAENKGVSSYDSLQSQRPEWRILASLVKALDRNYTGKKIKLRLERTASNVLFEMWGYDTDKLVSERPTADEADFDIVLVYKTVVDTVFVSAPAGGRKR